MTSSKSSTSANCVRGWILDVYPSEIGKIAVWVISEKGERIRFTDNFQPCIYVSARQEELECLISRLYNNKKIASVRFVQKYAQATDNEKSRVLELTVKDCRHIPSLMLEILRLGDYLRYEIHNCDVQNDRAYLFSHDLFPLAFIELKVTKSGLNYTLLDSVESTNYNIHKATLNNILDEFILSRDNTPFNRKISSGNTYFSYGRTFYRAGTVRLYRRIHIDVNNTFVIKESGFDGFIEIARTCRVPLHTAARFSIGSSMSSMQLYQAIKDDILVPRNKRIPEAFKSAFDLLVGDRGGLVLEPRLGVHDAIGELDFSSMYPSLMAKYNISAETVLCKCCPDSTVRIPELNYHICIKRVGIVPKTINLALTKRLHYKRLRDETADKNLKQKYDNRQTALKWILVTCFGYLGFKNSKFGTVDGHIAVCAFGRDAFLKAAHIAEDQDFEVIHGIVDSLWLKKKEATIEEYKDLCRVISKEIGVPINFEGRYKWVAFLPSKLHPRLSVLNRYFGVMEDCNVKVRGLEVRRRDTPMFIFDAQTEMINVLASTNNSLELYGKIPEIFNVLKTYRNRLLNGEIPIPDLIVSKHMSKQPKNYKQHVSQVIAAQQLSNQGIEVHAGNNIQFLFTNAEHKRYERRVKAMELIEKVVNPDTKKYLLLLYASTANLLSFSGYTAKKVYDAVKGEHQKILQ